ncbi:response regulator transcription factor [Blastococcus sp. MG754426]|uniref:LuxR C-terminal-related transcriptional regulator n=1 Tax=unclassified Blastococcus TaxID=2619396 RepID=UPI001EEFF323|nr:MULTISPECIES: response regulator transcription factor [unclassified Blastococcus]MCF6509660.1 response regulator transcription factor [Blastococcus sp. MG754426]MCF6510723.1 response regulator transcription factor [Blastococcus sp. MG754427]MCF6737170.1 response regulator transcription factor [Blastococcus sp. KM273129]
MAEPPGPALREVHVPMVAVVLVEEVTLFRQALAALLRLEPWVDEVRTAADAPAALGLADVRLPDVALVSLASRSGYQVLRDLRAALPVVRLVAVGVPEDGDGALLCARAGVDGVVLRDGDLRDLGATVVGVARGETVCPPAVVAALVRYLSGAGDRDDVPGDDGHLTSREREILVLIDEGLTNKEIAARLGIEVRTVKNHVHNVLAKLRVQHRGEAAARLRAARVPDLRALLTTPGTGRV